MANACATSARTVHGSRMSPSLTHRQSVDAIATLMSRKRRNCKNDNQGLIQSAERYYLFSTKRYSPSIAAVFAERGVLMGNGQASQTHSITLGEFYRLKNHHHNFALNKVFQRIPVWIDDVIRYEMSDAEVCFSDRCNEVCFADECRRDDERAA